MTELSTDPLGLGVSGRPKPQVVASNPALLASSGLLRRHDDDSMGTCAGGIARGKHYFTGPASVSATFTAACGDA